MLKRSRWLLLKRPEKLTGEQRGRLAELVRRNLRTVRAYLLKEDFQSLWGYVSPYWAGQFLDRWCTRTMRSRLDPMKEVARMVALAPRPDSELVPSPGAVLQWRCRRLQRKGQSDHQTGVWVPHLRGTGSRFVSRTWRPARTKTHPQILLTRPLPVRRHPFRDLGPLFRVSSLGAYASLPSCSVPSARNPPSPQPECSAVGGARWLTGLASRRLAAPCPGTCSEPVEANRCRSAPSRPTPQLRGLPQNLWVERRAGSPRQTHSVPVCSPPSRRVAPLRPRCAGLTAWTPAARTSVPALV